MKLYLAVLAVKSTVRRWWMMLRYVLGNRRGESKPYVFQREEYDDATDHSEITVGKTTYQVFSFSRSGDGREVTDLLLKLFASGEGR